MLSVLFLLVFAEHTTLGSASPTHSIISKRSALSNYQTENQPRFCSPGQVLSVDGLCITPEVREHVFVYNIPKQPKPGPPPYIPPPKVHKNILFVNLPEDREKHEAIVIPPPQQKNIVYVLNEEAQVARPKVIEVPAPPKVSPEVYFVNYGHGDNPVLPTGEDLQSVLLKDSQEVPIHSLGTGRQLSFGNNHLNQEKANVGATVDNLGTVIDNDHASTQISSQESSSHDTKDMTDGLGLTLDSSEHKLTEYKTLYYGDLQNRRFVIPRTSSIS
ncbi:uncharacterized protein [Macrobrachium rosenbergii]|uniref:uncharacterized protein n=1 Tax=Macrobrachium rosenbergii TaxID=79674 RepID=UPI0034D54C2D